MISLSDISKFQDTLIFSLLQNLLVVLIVISIFLYPSYFGPTRLENFALPLLFFVLAFKNLSFNRTIVIILIINLIMGMISVFANLNFNNGLMELIRWIKYILVLVFFSSLSKKEIKNIGVYIKAAFIGMVIINLLQLFNPMNLGVTVAKIYSHHPLYFEGANGIDRTFRLLGTAINPNNNAVLWLLMNVFFLVEFYEKRKIQSLIFAFLSFLFIIFTQSRTSLVIVLVIGMLNLFLYKLNLRHFLYLILVMLPGAFITIWFKFTYIWVIFLYNPLKIHSLQLRYAIWRDTLLLYFEKPIFGWGNFKNYEALYPKPVDNEFLYVLMNQGAVGFLGISMVFIYTFYYFFNKRKTYQYSYLPVFMVLCFMLIGMTNLAIMNVRVGLLFFMIWGITYTYRKQED